MKICIISHSVHPYSEIKSEYKHSSVNDVLFNLSYGFKSLGHDVFLILPKNSDSNFPSYISKGEYQPNLGISNENKLLCTATGSSLSEMMDYAFNHQHEFDIIINLGHDWLPNYMADKFKTPYISIPNLLYEDRPLEELIKIRAQNSPNNIMFISYAQRSILGTENNKVIYLPFDLNLFLHAKLKKENYLLWAGRITPEKGLREAIIFANNAGLPLFVAGEIQDYDYYNSLNNEFSFKYLGILNKNSLYSYMNNAKAFIQIQKNSLWKETFGRVTAEAMLNGCPVIFVENGANRELVELVNGGVEYFPTSNAKKILENISKINVESMQQLSQKYFSRETICMEYINHFNNLINLSS